MIVLGVAVELAQLSQLGHEPYIERLAGFGVGAIEAQLSAEMRSNDIARWGATIEAAARHGLAVTLHAPLPADAVSSRPELLQLARAASSAAPATLVVHGCSGPRPDPTLAACTAEHLRRLAAAAPDIRFALENVANVDHGPVARVRAWASRRRVSRPRGRPSGVGSGMGGTQAAVPLPAVDEPVDLPLSRRPGRARWNAAASREAALAICASVARPNCVFAWDLAHDWLAGRVPGALQATVPGAELLRRVGYVRVHDVDDSGRDHCLLVMGNVPYTTQLRALSAAGYAGTVCLAARYTAVMRPYGGRWQTLERSIGVLQQVLRLR